MKKEHIRNATKMFCNQRLFHFGHGKTALLALGGLLDDVNVVNVGNVDRITDSIPPNVKRVNFRVVVVGRSVRDAKPGQRRCPIQKMHGDPLPHVLVHINFVSVHLYHTPQTGRYVFPSHCSEF